MYVDISFIGNFQEVNITNGIDYKNYYKLKKKRMKISLLDTHIGIKKSLYTLIYSLQTLKVESYIMPQEHQIFKLYENKKKNE